MSTLPHELNRVAQVNGALICRLLFKVASRTLLEFVHNHRRLGGEPGITMVLHAWAQSLEQHIDVHCIVSDSGLSPNGQRWFTPVRKGFPYPNAVHSKAMRGKYLSSLGAAHRHGELWLEAPRGDDSREFECPKTALRSHDLGG